MANSLSFSPDVINIVEAVKRREEQKRVIQIEEHHVQIVVYLLDDNYYAFSGDAIQEIVPVQKITYVPGMPACLPGVIHVRGNIESVLDIRQVLGLPAAVVTARSRIALGQAGDLRSGVLVDSVEDVLEIPEDAIHEPASDIDAAEAAFVIGETIYNGHPLIVLDLGKIFDTLLAAPL